MFAESFLVGLSVPVIPDGLGAIYDQFAVGGEEGTAVISLVRVESLGFLPRRSSWSRSPGSPCGWW